MDFTLTDEQQALADLTGQILGDLVPAERLRELEQTDDRFAADAWTALAEAGVIGVAVPEAHGGLGFGLLELCLVLEQVGRHVAPVPLLPTAAYGALAVARFGTPDQQARWLPGVAAGATVLTGALGADLAPSAHLASAIVIATEAETRIVEIADVELEREEATTLEPHFRVVGHGDGERLGGPEVLEWLRPRAVVAHCAVQAGVCEGALRITAGYVSEREQFGSKIGTFQAVGQRAADAYIDTDAVRLTMLQAAWLLATDRPAAEAVAVAKFWAGEGAQRVVHAAQHLHGGIGVDLDYPIHRYFRWAKLHELALGSGAEHLAALGDLLAAG